MVETYQHNMEGNVRQSFADSFFSLSGDEILYIVSEDRSPKLHFREVFGISAPPLALELQLIAGQRTTHYAPTVLRLPSFAWYGNHFPFKIYGLFRLVWPPGGVRHAGICMTLIVWELKDQQTPSVTVERSLS